MKNVSGLEIDQDLPFQEKEWKIQRIAWALMLLIVLLGLLGLFGQGIISDGTASTSDEALVVYYQRFQRLDGQGSLVIQVAPELITGDTIQVAISSAFLDEVEIQGYSQEPSEVRNAGDRLVMEFAVDQPGEPVGVTISFIPQSMGRLSGTIGLVDGPDVEIGQFVYP